MSGRHAFRARPCGHPASADAIDPPAPTTATDTPSTEADGPIPLDRHKKILDGIYKERDDARTQLDSWKAYEWAKQVPREQFDAMAAWYGKAQANPVEFALGLVEELSGDAQHAAVLRSQAGRMLRAARVEAPAGPTVPDIPIYDEQGQKVASLNDIVQQHLAPYEAKEEARAQREAKQQEAAEQAALDRQVNDYVSSESQAIKAAIQEYPHAKERWDAIVEKAKTYPESLPVERALMRAYREVVLPTLPAAAKAEMLGTLQTKAAAATVNPSGAVVAAPRRPKSLLDPGLTW